MTGATQLQSLNCNSCGAQLRVAESAKFVTCSHCDAQLAIHRNETSFYTEQIAELKQQTSAMAAVLARHAYDKQLERVDEDWDYEEEEYFASDAHGRVAGPAAVIFGGVMFVIMGVTSWLLFPLWQLKVLGVPFVIIGGVMIVRGMSQQRAYDKAYEAYVRRRANVKLADFLPRWRREKR